MKIIRNIILGLTILIVMILCGTLILKIFDLLLNLEYENIWISGFKVGLISWFGILIDEFYHFIKNKKNK